MNRRDRDRTGGKGFLTHRREFLGKPLAASVGFVYMYVY